MSLTFVRSLELSFGVFFFFVLHKVSCIMSKRTSHFQLLIFLLGSHAQIQVASKLNYDFVQSNVKSLDCNIVKECSER